MKALLTIGAIFAVLALGRRDLAGAQPPAKASAQTSSGDAGNGKKLYGKYGCYECHGWEGQGGYAGVRIAPNPMPYAAFVRYVRAPRGVMPPYSEKLLKSEQDLSDIYAYLKARPPAVPVASLPGK
jgi:mono/diheme cytochrome c family protein